MFFFYNSLSRKIVVNLVLTLALVGLFLPDYCAAKPSSRSAGSTSHCSSSHSFSSHRSSSSSHHVSCLRSPSASHHSSTSSSGFNFKLPSLFSSSKPKSSSTTSSSPSNCTTNSGWTFFGSSTKTNDEPNAVDLNKSSNNTDNHDVVTPPPSHPGCDGRQQSHGVGGWWNWFNSTSRVNHHYHHATNPTGVTPASVNSTLPNDKLAITTPSTGWSLWKLFWLIAKLTLAWTILGYLICYCAPLGWYSRWMARFLIGTNWLKTLSYRGLIKYTQPPFGHIDPAGLWALCCSEADFLVIDAKHPDCAIERNPVLDNIKLHSGKSERSIRQQVGDHEALYILYDDDAICPSAWMLAERMQELGFVNLLLLQGGSPAWQLYLEQHPEASNSRPVVFHPAQEISVELNCDKNPLI